MMSSIQKLVEEARDLPQDQKLSLANRVLELAEPVATDDVEDQWDSELRARIRAYDAGRSQTRPAGEVFRDLDSKLPS
jgi:hypothetical protein